MASQYSAATPAGEGPDEPGHIAYVQFLRGEKRLPVHGDGEGPLVQQVKHPPLYYLAGALVTSQVEFGELLFFPNPQFTANLESPRSPTAHRHTLAELPPLADGYKAARLLRLLSVALASVVVASTYSLGRRVWPDNLSHALAASTVVGFLPQFLFMQSVANNDSLANALGALALALSAKVATGGSRRDEAALGCVVGLGWLTKLTLLPHGAVAALALVVAAGPPAGHLRAWLVGLAARMVRVWLPVLAVAGWWFARNVALTGDLLGWSVFAQAAVDSARTTPLGPDLPEYLRQQVTSTLGWFGWMAVPMPHWTVQVFSGLLVAAALGIGAAAFRGLFRDKADTLKSSTNRSDRRALAVVGLAAVLIYISVFRLALAFDLVAAQGRYLFTGLAAYGVLFVAGLLAWLPLRGRPAAAAVLAVAAIALGGLGLSVLSHGFGWPPDESATGVATAGRAGDDNLPAEARFGPWVRLLNVHMPIEPVRAGTVITVTLLWDTSGEQPHGAFMMFAQLTDASGRVIDQVDWIPQGGKYSSSSWLPSVRFVEELRFRIPEDAEPGVGAVALGWYEEGAPWSRVPAELADGRVADAWYRPIVILTHAAVPQDEVEIPTPAAWVTGAGVIELVGFSWRSVGNTQAPEDGRGQTGNAGDDSILVLYWRTGQRQAEDYTVFVHLYHGDDLVAVADGPPAQGRFPTSKWPAGEIIRDARTVGVSSLAPATYTVSVGLYDHLSTARLNRGDLGAVDMVPGTEPEGFVLGTLEVDSRGSATFRPTGR